MKPHLKAISVAKPELGNTICEDASRGSELMIAISDGAGGGGVFADRWAQYLVGETPEAPMSSFDEFAAWLEGIWNPFYEAHEVLSQQQGGMFQTKFYDEGSFATFVAAWRVGKQNVKWVAYGDTVVFHYNRQTKELYHSFSSLADFSQPPYLLNWKDEPVAEGFKSGEFCVEQPAYVFACSDALAHYILMMYVMSKGETLEAGENKNGRLIQMAQQRQVDFEKQVLKPLFNALKSNALESHLRSLYRQGILGLDDYSLARLM